MRPNFAECGARFTSSNDTFTEYIYHGRVPNVFSHTQRPKLITYEGCRQLCGRGSEYYAWKDTAQTITTWVLPIIGLLVQAPFESNAFRRTVFALARWIGSPMATLSYTLWNIRISSKCATMVDMATDYNDFPDQGSHFGQIRDSFYILSVMNQYSIKEKMPAVEAEKLLRIALFSDSLRLSHGEDQVFPDDVTPSLMITSSKLVLKRQALARSLRENRKKAVVPVFVSLMWFLFSLAISIQASFGDLGSNQTAHDLALGLLLAWLPVMILVTIVDRNPTAIEPVRRKLNNLVDEVRAALLDPELRDSYITDTRRSKRDFPWTECLRNEDFFYGDFFTHFSGQGRVRWHYGVAHSILAGIESKFMAAEGRNWLSDPDMALTHMVDGPGDGHFAGLRSIDLRMIWQLLSSILIVVGTAFGAFILSYFTPTVGLGCRSGGYLIYVLITLVNLLIEMFVWWFSREGQVRSWVRRQSAGNVLTKVVSHARFRVNRRESDTWASSIFANIRDGLQGVSDMSGKDKTTLFILRPMDIIASIWLAYIVSAQTFGSYQNCECFSSIWGTNGGYMDFETYDFYRAHGVELYWAAGTALSTGLMGVAFAFVVVEYCIQSHLSTENYEDAMQGLRRTRQFKKYTAWLRDIPDYTIDTIKRLWFKTLRRNRQYTHEHQSGRYGQGGRRSLLWTWSTKRQRARRTDDGILEGIPLHRQESPRQPRQDKGFRSAGASTDTEMEPYRSPVEHDGQYPPELPTLPFEVPLEEGGSRNFYRRF